MISRKIKSIDNTDGSAYDTDIGVNVPKMDPGTLANPSELLVPAEVEVSPSYDSNSITSQLAALLAYELICLI